MSRLPAICLTLACLAAPAYAVRPPAPTHKLVATGARGQHPAKIGGPAKHTGVIGGPAPRG